MDLFACNGILFNHESPSVVKLLYAKNLRERCARILHWVCRTNYSLATWMRNVNWGHARDYVEVM
jgi:GDP-D-mannose dehydratase